MEKVLYIVHCTNILQIVNRTSSANKDFDVERSNHSNCQSSNIIFYIYFPPLLRLFTSLRSLYSMMHQASSVEDRTIHNSHHAYFTDVKSPNELQKFFLLFVFNAPPTSASIHLKLVFFFKIFIEEIDDVFEFVTTCGAYFSIRYYRILLVSFLLF